MSVGLCVNAENKISEQDVLTAAICCSRNGSGDGNWKPILKFWRSQDLTRRGLTHDGLDGHSGRWLLQLKGQNPLRQQSSSREQGWDI